MTYSERLSIITGKLLGDHQFFTIEQRFYIGICFFSSLAFFISAILNYLIHLPVLMTMTCLFLGTLYFIYYYFNRFKIISIHSFWLLFFPCGFFLLPVWFYGGGISGPAMVISIIIIALSSLVATRRQQVYSAGIIVFILGNLFVIEYYYPHLVFQYPSRLDRFTDNYFTIIIAVLITCFVTRLMMTHLKHEREETIKTKKQLIQSEYLFRTLAQTTSTGIMLYQNETCIYANPAAERLSGYGYDELRTMKIWELVSPDQKEMVKALMKMRADGKFPPSGYELRIINRKGEPKQVYVEGNTMEYYGQPAGLISIIDMTELKSARDHVEHLKNYLTTIFDSMPSVLVGVDLNGYITHWNRQAEQDTGISIHDAINQSLYDMLPRLGKKQQEINAAICHTSFFENYRLVTRNGRQTRYEEVTVYPIQEKGFAGAVIRIDDVTKRTAMEEMLVQSEKMLSLGGLAAGMAHEINNPLAGMVQNAQLVISRLTNDIPANHTAAQACGTTMDVISRFMEKRQVIKQLENINRAGMHAAKIVSNMLSFARKDQTAKSGHDLSVILLKAVELAKSDYHMKKKYDFKKIKIICEFDENVPMVVCEESKVIQVLLNVFKNAAQSIHMAESTIVSPRLVLRLNTEPEHVVIEIEDNGPGMDESTRKRIFDPFFTTRDVDQGTGLGLSLSYYIIVDEHQGEMTVSSNPGQGTLFIIKLPVESVE